jgi:FkbM family methyltransferase
MSGFARVTERVQQQLIEWLRSMPLVRTMARRLVKGRWVTIPSGQGAGLRFHPGESNPAYALGTNEMPVQEAFAQRLKPGDVFFDIGANVGFFTVIGARLVGANGFVYAFEPLPENVQRARANVEANAFSNVRILDAAVSDHSGMGELMVAGYVGGSALATAERPPDVKGVLPVRLVTIDELVAQNEIRPPQVVKIDVEGAEIEVLFGMAHTLDTCRPVVVFEIDDQSQEAYDLKYKSCLAFLEQHGYQVSTLENSYPGAGWIVGNYVAEPE